MKSVNQIIHDRRIELKLTLQEIADYVGVNNGTVSRWEKGQINNMGRTNIIKLAQILKIDPRVLMGGDSVPKHPIRSTEIAYRFNDFINEINTNNPSHTLDGKVLSDKELKVLSNGLEHLLETLRTISKINNK